MDLDATLRDLAPRVIRYCAGHVGDRSIGEELAQESLAALVRAVKASRPPRNPEAFVFAIARRRAIRTRVRRALLLPLQAVFDRHAAGRNPEEALIARDEHARLLSAVARLPRREREALLLVVAGEQRADQAAALLGVSPSAVRMRMMRARQRLLSMLDGHHEG